MKNRRLKQFAASLFVVLSLLVSSVSAACTCATHRAIEQSEHCQPKANNHSHQAAQSEHPHASHEHSDEVSGEHRHAESADTKDFAQALSAAECCCVQPAPQVSAKIETVKIEKQAAILNRISLFEIAFVPEIIRAESRFVATLYLTDSFYNLSPGRAPPVL